MYELNILSNFPKAELANLNGEKQSFKMHKM